MEMVLTAESVAFIVSMFVSALMFSFFGRVDYLQRKMVGSAIFIILGLTVGCFAVLPFFWYEYDFIVEINFWKFLIPFLGGAIIIGAAIFERNYFVSLAVLLAVILGVFILDIEISFFERAPRFINQGITVAVWWLFAMGYRALSGLNTLPQVEAMTVGLGFLLLSWFGVAPLMIGVFSASLIAVFIIAYLYSAANPVGILVSPVVGFVLGWLGLMVYGEYLLPCFVIFMMYYIVEFVVCFFKKITFLPQYRDFEYNSITFQSFYNGLPVMVVIKNVWMINAILLVLGLFQLSGVNSYSIPIFVALLVSWQLYRMFSWEDGVKVVEKEMRVYDKDLEKTDSNTDKN